MDLVKFYDSDPPEGDSDIEEIEVAPVKPPVAVIDLESESEDESIIEKTKTTEDILPAEKSDTNTTVEIDCIDLEMSSPEKEPHRKEASVAAPDSGKKIDYLNLEDSDSDIEIEDANENINTLMETASVLNEKPSGPQKPIEVSDSRGEQAENTALEIELDKVAASNAGIESICSSSRNTPDIANSNTSCDNTDNSVPDPNSKHFRAESPMKTFYIQPDLEDDISKKNLSCIFRDDNHVSEASEKNVACRIPRQIIQTHNAHTNIITSLSWCISKFSYLFLSAALDGSLKIWDLYRRNSVQCIKAASGLNAAKWSLDGGQVITGGGGKKAFVYDVQYGKKIVEYDIYNIISSLEVHPYMEDVFLVGTRNAILGFDIRVNTTYPIRSYFSKCEEVLDIAFLDENEFICSTNIVSHDSADRTIMAWDFSSGAILSNQIYLERFTCPSLRVHPSDSSFIAQTNGNYIATFSSSRPYKVKNKRYMGHKVSGYGIECDISPDGKYIVTGDADGSLYFYNYTTTNIALTTAKRKVPTNRVRWHPAFSSTLISSTYDGQINVWK